METPATPLCIGAITCTSATGSHRSKCLGMKSVHNSITFCTQSSAESAMRKVMSEEAWMLLTAVATTGSDVSAELIA